ncbi:MAG: hypothetical protein IJV20_10285 [Prevotella sp.]|nr:hypothetical protein [Prevotella sp.]
MKHAILVLAHKMPEMLTPVLKYFSSDCAIYIHFDASHPLPDNIISLWRDFQQVRGIYQEYKVNWGSFSVLEAELFLLQQAVNDSDADYYHLISGQDYPIKPLKSFLSFFTQQPNRDYIEYKVLDTNKPNLDYCEDYISFNLTDSSMRGSLQGNR